MYLFKSELLYFLFNCSPFRHCTALWSAAVVFKRAVPHTSLQHFEGQREENAPFLSESSVGAGDVSSAVTSTAPSAPSFPANISSRLLSSSEICSTLRFVSAGDGQRQRTKCERRRRRKRKEKKELNDAHFVLVFLTVSR